MIDTTKIVQALRVNGTPMTLAGASGEKIKATDMNAVMTGNFYDLLTDSFIDQIMTGHYIKK